MNRSRQHALARAARSGHQDGRLAVGYRFDQFKYPCHFVVLADNVVQTVLGFELAAKMLIVLCRRVLTDGPFNSREQLIVMNRAGQIIASSLFHGLYRVLNGAVCGHQDYRRSG